MNAFLQVLLHLKPVQERLHQLGWYDHQQSCGLENPADCLLCQLMKVAQAMKEGGKERSVHPRMLKQAIGRLSAAFNNNQQQGKWMNYFFTICIILMVVKGKGKGKVMSRLL